MDELLTIGGLFGTAVLSALLLPGSSEAVLAGLATLGEANPWLLLAVATAGNVLGSVINWVCGRFLARFRDRRWFPVSERRYDQAAGWYQRYGKWSLLFSWAPFVGDPLTVIAGALRVNILPFVVLVTIGKAARYAAVLAVALAWVGQGA